MYKTKDVKTAVPEYLRDEAAIFLSGALSHPCLDGRKKDRSDLSRIVKKNLSLAKKALRNGTDPETVRGYLKDAAKALYATDTRSGERPASTEEILATQLMHYHYSFGSNN